MRRRADRTGGARGTTARLLAAAAEAVLIAAALLFAPLPVITRQPTVEPLRGDSDVRGAASSPLPQANHIGVSDRPRLVFGYLRPDERFDAYALELPAAGERRLYLNVPADQAGESVPRLTVLDDRGARYAEVSRRDHERGQPMYEPFSQQTLRRGGAADVRFRDGATYYLRVDPGPRGYRGPYVLLLDGSGEVTPAEAIVASVSLPRIWLGLYGRVRLKPDGLLRVALGAALLAVSAVGAHRLRRPSRRRSGGARRSAA